MRLYVYIALIFNFGRGSHLQYGNGSYYLFIHFPVLKSFHSRVLSMDVSTSYHSSKVSEADLYAAAWFRSSTLAHYCCSLCAGKFINRPTCNLQLRCQSRLSTECSNAQQAWHRSQCRGAPIMCWLTFSQSSFFGANQSLLSCARISASSSVRATRLLTS